MSKNLTDSYIANNKFVSMSDMLKEYGVMKEAIKNLI